MPGISACGVHLPRLRLPLSLIHAPQQPPSAREKAVAGPDEDVLTMAVAAARDCLAAREPGMVDHLYLASTSTLLAEKSGAAIVAKAVGLRPDVLAVDYGGSLRSGAAALAAALAAVRSGAAAAVLVVTSDARTAEPQSALELDLGDAAVALLVEADAALQVGHEAAATRQVWDVWREDGAATLHSWEERFVVRHGFAEPMAAAFAGWRAASGLDTEAIRSVACYAPDGRSHRELARQLGFRPEQLVDPLFGRIGNCGTAFVPLQLVAALERAEPGDRLLTGFAGDGAHWLDWQLQRPLPQAPRLAAQLAQRQALGSYQQYLRCRQFDLATPARAAADGISATVSYRDQDADIGFIGARCRRCDTEQFPRPRVCCRCHARDDFAAVPLAARTGTLLSYTLDYFFPAVEPPVVAGVCALGGSARAYLQLADYAGEELRTGLPVEFVFRRIHAAGGRPAYYWKARLLAAAAAGAGAGRTGDA